MNNYTVSLSNKTIQLNRIYKYILNKNNKIYNKLFAYFILKSVRRKKSFSIIL